MARSPILIYESVLKWLDDSGREDKDGFVTQGDIEEAFLMNTDMCRSETIKKHIDKMCRFNLLLKRGEISYQLSPEWREIIRKNKRFSYY